ncbi:hypothetical protein BsWGS_26014 [Bradybaena similaris]
MPADYVWPPRTTMWVRDRRVLLPHGSLLPPSGPVRDIHLYPNRRPSFLKTKPPTTTAHPHTAHPHTAHPHTAHPHTAHPHTAHPHTAHPHTAHPHTAHPHTAHPHTAL